MGTSRWSRFPWLGVKVGVEAVCLAERSSKPCGSESASPRSDEAERPTRRNGTAPQNRLAMLTGTAGPFYDVKTQVTLTDWCDPVQIHLLWRAKTECVPSGVHGAPSWSQAALRGEIEAHGAVHSANFSFARIVRCDVALADDMPPSGGPVHGALVLRAPIVRVIVGDPESGKREQVLYAVEGAINKNAM